ncbi:MAG: alpha/beta fold hydrolase [Bryobacteraceae bacterium]|nr:alpha/beta fold hydrolase [Bryobacteraceae bacterium]
MPPQPFRPLVRNPHFLTIFGNFAKRRLDTTRFPIQEQRIETESGVEILVHSQRPPSNVKGELVMVHGLEGSSNAGYLRSMAQLALEHGYGVHRTNMRACGGTDEHCRTMYHAGLTSDTLAIIRRIGKPVYLLGYSLGGNVSLKLAGELGDGGKELLRGLVAISAPIDLAACVRQLQRPQNRIYEWRFLRALKARIRRREGPAGFAKLGRVRSVYDFDDAYVAPFFGFGTADNYYATQSSLNFLSNIRVPTLVIQAEDDPMIPFEIFADPRLTGNPQIQLTSVKHGGHLGFIASNEPHFWVDRVILDWIEGH